jgi:hypothetical protein
MANISISNVCNLKCPYCFAATHMHSAGKTKPAFIDVETFAERLDFLARSGIDQIRLIGGEPTLHPDFLELIDLALERGKKLLIFSHGLIPERALRCLETIPPLKCLVLINTNATRSTGGPDQDEVAQRETSFRRLGLRAVPGFNIYQPNFRLEPILALIRATGCSPTIRLGLAHPMLSGTNIYLHTKHYPEVGCRLAHFAQIAAAEGVRLELDCGFVRCMFTEKELAILQESGTDLGWRCNPILDIGIDGRAIHCFPLTGRWEIPVENDSAAAALRQQFTRITDPYHLTGIYKACATCGHKQSGNCHGGCLAHIIRRFRHHKFQLKVGRIDRRQYARNTSCLHET